MFAGIYLCGDGQISLVVLQVVVWALEMSFNSLWNVVFVLPSLGFSFIIP